MVTINREPFNVYQLDTVDTLKKRVAAKFDSLPKFIIFEPEITNNPEGNYEIIDLLKYLRNSDENIFNIYEQFKGYMVEPLDLIKVWASYNEEISNLAIRFSISDQIKDITSNFDLDNFLRDEKNYKKDLEKSINNNKRDAENFVKVFKTFAEVSGLEHTKFKLDTISFSLILNLTDVSLLDIFNAMILNPVIPMATIKNFFKIYHNFKPPSTWSISLENAIIAKVSNFKDIILAPLKYYQDIFFYIEEGKIIVNLDFSKEKSSLSKNEMIDRVLNSISGYKISILSEREEKLKGVYYYPSQKINKYIFADMAMNDPLVSLFINIDEGLKATKSKPSIYFYFRDPKYPDEIISIVITEKIMTASESEFRNENSDLFPINDPFLRVRISNAKSYRVVDNFINIFSKLLEIYNEKYDEMLKLYRSYFPDFGKEKITAVSESRGRLKDIAPNVFPSLYSVKCKYRPELTEDKNELPSDSSEWIQFPATPEEGKQNYYYCPYPKHKYPGLLVNRLENRDRFPFLPCCYVKDRSKSAGSNYRKYYYGEESESKKQQTVFSSNKAATSAGYGHLPEKLKELFQMIDLSGDEYLRKGTAKSPSSFLECVLESLHEETGFLNPIKGSGNDLPSDKIRISRTQKWRKKIATWENLAVGRQEFYYSTTENIASSLKNVEIYMEPKMYVNILQAYFNCNIFIFSREGNGQMELPNFSQAFLRYPLRKRPTILIYEHKGSRAESLKYPQCEIIARWDPVKEARYNLENGNPIVKELEFIFNKLSLVYNFEQVVPTLLPNLKDFKVKSQGFDSFGKTRVICIEFEGDTHPMITDPIPPLNIRESTDDDFSPWTKEKILRFFVKISINDFIQNIDNNGVLREVCAEYGTTSVIFPIGNNSKINQSALRNVATISQPTYLPLKDESDMKEYNYSKRMARFLTEYFIYFFSSYIKLKNIEEISSNVLEEFVRNKVSINTDHTYKNIKSKVFSMTSSFFQNGKIVINSDELLRRLLYVLRLRLQQRFKDVINYYQKENISNFYVEISDFDFHPDEVILQGENSLEKWIMDQEDRNIMRHEIFPGKRPYFFQNEKLGTDIYLAQNTSSYQEGVEIGKIWYAQGYNPIKTNKNQENLSFHLYTYTNAQNIKPYKVVGKPNKYNIIILGYKEAGIAKYTILLPLLEKHGNLVE